MDYTIIPTIDRGIVNKQVLEIVYKDEVRLVEPHTLGQREGELEDNWYLRAWQLDDGWKLFRVAQLQVVRPKMQDGQSVRFDTPRKGYNEKDPFMTGGIFSTLLTGSPAKR